MRQMLRTTWMFFWRLLVLSAIFNIHIIPGSPVKQSVLFAVIIAFFMVYWKNISIYSFPLIRLVRARPVVAHLNPETKELVPDGMPYVERSSFGGNRPVRMPNGPVQPEPPQKQDKTTNKGVYTGFEPQALEGVSLPLNNPRAMMYGTPGAGLQSSNLSHRTAQIGSDGETQFAKALVKSNIVGKVASFWSTSVPERARRNLVQPLSGYQGDVDCVIIVGDSIFLVDVKRYQGGDGVYQNISEDSLGFYDGVTGNLVGEPYHLSKNMKFAAEQYRKCFPRMMVVPVVVLMPTERGESRVDNVVWPGGIRAMTYTEFSSYMETMTRKNQMPNASVVQELTSLLRS